MFLSTLCPLLYALYMVWWFFWQVADLCPLLYTLVADVAVDWTLVERVSIAGWIWLSSAVLVGLMLLAVGALLGEFTMAVCW